MSFDATIAIAKLELATGTDRPDLDNLRARYPELGFVFDLLEDKLQEAEHAAIEYRDERREIERGYQQGIDALECRVQDMRLAFEQIRELTVDADAVPLPLAEKLPMALVETSSGVVEVAEDLTVLPGAERTARVDLPVVTGAAVELEPGGVVECGDVAAALELVRRAREVSALLWEEISEVRIAPGSGLIIYTVADGAQIRVGSGALDTDGLRRLSLVLEDLRARGVTAESIDLRFRGQAVVRLAAGTLGGRV